MLRVGALLIAFSGACVQTHEGPGVVGTPGDMHTQPGDYIGYRVVTRCTGSWADVGVTGTGGVVLATNEEISAAGQDLHAAVADIASIWGWAGYGLVCEPGIGTTISLDSWYDVDQLVVRVGDWLHAHDYGLQVAISVDGVPVPVAN